MVVISVVVVTGATVVSTSAGVSVNPVIMSSATSSAFTVVTTEARVVTTGAAVVSTLGASVVVVSVSMGGAQEMPAASSRGAKKIFIFICFLFLLL